MGWVDLSGLKDKKKILSLLDKWPSLKKSFYNDYNGDFDNMESLNQNKGLWNSVKRWMGFDSFSEVNG